MRKRIPRRILTAALSLAMLLTLLPATALADGETGETTTSGIELSKTATLEDDGTYTIDLDAYATGETTTTTTESSVPLDIVLVIDQSGSMAYNDSGSSTNTESDRRYYKLKAAVTSFAETIAENAESTGADHRIAITGYGTNGSQGTTSVTGAYKSPNSNTSYWVNTGLFVNGTLKNYGGDSNSTYNTVQLSTEDYQKALVSAYDENTDAVTASITTAISNFAAYGGTYTEYGLLMAQNVFANNSASYTYTDDNGETQTGTRKRIVVLFTDGETNSSVSTVLSYSNTLKSTYSATVYCVGFGSSVDSNFLSYVSSNYGSDTSYSSSFWSSGYSGTSNNTTKYSMTATNSSELNNIFQTITEDVSNDSTTVTLNAESVMKDIMGEGFTLTDDSTVSIKTVAGTSDGTTVTWGDETTNNASYTISEDKTTVSVTGFNYADKYISSGHAGEKICVTITGVLPTTDVTTDEAVSTNAATSGIYATSESEEPTATFEQPQTIITKKLYVLDYAKDAALTGLDQTSVTGIVSSYQKVTSDNSALTQSYGTSALSGSTLTYTPTTMSWDGYDSLYVFGQTTDEEVMGYDTNTNACEEGTANLWSKVSVIPASNVYYEDDFVTNESDGIVGITYSGIWTTVSGDTSSASTSQSSENILYGTDASYADDTTYANGSAQKGESGATATFTFTGTGVDIYSSTDNDACAVYVYLYDANGTMKQYVVANNYAANGKYYVVPTVTFENLNYDTYTVKLRVVKSSTDSVAVNYYLDGIRVYNPLGTVTNNGSDAGDAYAAADELNAKYTEIRSMLLNSTADVDGEGMLFIDDIDSTDNKNGEDTDDIIGTYDEEGNYISGTYESVGPEHEVYLSEGNGVAFTLKNFGNGDAVYVGIKSAQGYTGTVEVTNGDGDKAELKITSTADQYYKITPDSNGNVVIVNTGKAVVSLTKVRTTSPDTNDISFVSNETTVTAISSFSLLSSSSYTDEPITDVEAEAGNDNDAAVDTETEDGTTGDVVIETETPEQGSSSGSSSQNIFSSIFSKIIGWMSGRR